MNGIHDLFTTLTLGAAAILLALLLVWVVSRSPRPFPRWLRKRLGSWRGISAALTLPLLLLFFFGLGVLLRHVAARCCPCLGPIDFVNGAFLLSALFLALFLLVLLAAVVAWLYWRDLVRHVPKADDPEFFEERRDRARSATLRSLGVSMVLLAVVFATCRCGDCCSAEAAPACAVCGVPAPCQDCTLPAAAVPAPARAESGDREDDDDDDREMREGRQPPPKREQDSRRR